MTTTTRRYGPKRRPVSERFWEKVDVRGPDECWEWTRSRNPSGYGSYSSDGRWCNTHRWAWELTFGPIPKGLDVMHKCDNPPCCNPDHLSLGTHSHNLMDSSRKGRIQRGERHGLAKLNDERVREIRKAAAGGETQRSIAKRYQLTQSTISLVVRRQRWAHVDD